MNDKTISFIPPLFYGNEFITDFKGKAIILNLLFANQCTLLGSSIKIPIKCERKILNSLSAIEFMNNHTDRIIKKLESY